MLNTTKSEQPGAVQLFTHPSFGTIRTAGDADNPLFCLKDVCKALGLQSGHVIERLDKGSVSTEPLLTNGGTQLTKFVNEDGLYDTIFDSRKPEAKAFRKWVTSEVLPSIRKTGHYGVAKTDSSPVSLEERILNILTLLEKRITALEENQLPLLPAPAPSKPAGAWTLGEIASELDVDSYYLTCLLSSINVINKTRHVVTCATKRAESLFLNLPYGVPYIGGTERWDGIIVTEKGRKEILDCFSTYKKQHPYL